MAVRRRGGECKGRKRIKERKGKMRRKEREIRGFLLFAFCEFDRHLYNNASKFLRTMILAGATTSTAL
ncbi:unnamed protein product [Musa acuminata subsp. malaccensis]|uniref:(wild Malaysian banana) hypothetical protein n=1 Tax=Musa acuminata subsp. malaccensis TaxID=214687 RepID=A0A804KHY2_MUSAM|nr:unnamed protein product [Musa acuminata subsp. malaccensis]